ncbi:phenylalanine--tRNA ligase subunit alpha [Candidatus Saccharibacteria bacterium]|nr:phenylalanine--tRNA ligase subunit alpha [Candidatus Saccharibacteria bacterium]
MEEIAQLESTLLARIDELETPRDILKAPEIKQLYAKIPTLDPAQRGVFGQKINGLKQALERVVAEKESQIEESASVPLDVTAPLHINSKLPKLLSAEQGTVHPLRQEIAKLIEIFGRMGFVAEESRELDDQYHMFESLNFPAGHPARDEYDTFMTVQKDTNEEAFVAPAHTSTMQNRILKKYKENLDKDEPIAAVVPDRTFRNEDLDARHEHTFYQIEGVYVAKNVHAGMLIATLQKFLEEYYGKKLEVRVNPFYFPFTEPSFEFALSCPFCEGTNPSCKVCGGEGWIELLGCGMIHPRVLQMAGIDPSVYTGFAFGCGIDRLVMMKYAIEDVRHFESAKLDFLKQF